MKKRICENVDLADSEYHSIDFEGNNLKLTLKGWDEKKIECVFLDTIQFVYKFGDVTQKIVESDENRHFFNEALEREYIKVPSTHPYRLYQIIDIYDHPYIEVVATNVKAIKVE